MSSFPTNRHLKTIFTFVNRAECLKKTGLNCTEMRRNQNQRKWIFPEVPAAASDLDLLLEPGPVPNQTRELPGLFYTPSLLLLYTTIQLGLVFLPISTAEAARSNTGRHLVWDQGAEHLGPSLSHGQRMGGEREVPRGWETYGLAWCYVTPQPSPSARRPRCARPAGLSPSPTPLELCHSWLFNRTSIRSLLPMTTHLRVQIRHSDEIIILIIRIIITTAEGEEARGGCRRGRGREGVWGESLGIC